MTAVELTFHVYPASPAEQQELIALWRSEWPRTDYDWLEALNGDYAETLTTVSVVARIAGRPVATASVNFARHAPETCLVGNVVTLAEHRGKGLAATVTDSAVEQGFAAGCDVAFLGSSRLSGNVYERCGFVRLAGYIMRRPGPGFVEPDPRPTPGPVQMIRPAVWGDMPAFVRFLTQPLADIVVDYPRGLVSIAHADPVRCVSAFAVVHDDVQRHDGAMLVLAEGHRVFGLATLTPGPIAAGRHRAMIDFATHEACAMRSEEMLARLRLEAAERDIRILEAWVAVADAGKLATLLRAGFQPMATLRGHLMLRDGPADVVQLEARL